MKRSILLSLSILYAIITFSQDYATDFSVDDCSGNFHNLFTELDEGKVIVIAWVMPCFGCIGPALEAYTVAKSFESTHPGQVLYYMPDDYANTSCSSLTSWAENNSMGEADAYFSHSDINMNDYGTPGMPKIVVVGCSSHKVFYNMNYTAAGIEDAINEAIEECNTSQEIFLEAGFQFVSSNLLPDEPDMLILLSDILNENLVFVRNSEGATLRKIGPNWVNGIGDWIGIEGYLVKTNESGQFNVEGSIIPVDTPIDVEAGFQFVSYLPEFEMDAMEAFSSIIGDNLVYIRDSEGSMLRKIGPNWVNGIGNCAPTQGYLVKMNGDGTLVYPE